VRHIFRMPRHTNFKLRIRMDDDNPHQPQAPRPPRSKVKVTRSRDQFEPSWPNVVIRGRWGHTGRPNPAATLLACSHKNIIHNRKQYNYVLQDQTARNVPRVQHAGLQIIRKYILYTATTKTQHRRTKRKTVQITKFRFIQQSCSSKLILEPKWRRGIDSLRQ